ncbi:MAG: hypothetical protein IKR57_04910 [Bacilli bacterium]|nr:hypothetical protein [Bacilli bacterium]
MKKELPKIYVNKIDKINNNEEVYYSYKDNSDMEINEEIVPSIYEMQNRIDELFRSSDFIYKKRFHIKTKYGEGDYDIISKSYDYLLTIDGEKIYIDNILEIY